MENKLKKMRTFENIFIGLSRGGCTRWLPGQILHWNPNNLREKNAKK